MVSIWMVGLNIFRHSKSLTTQKALPPRHVMFSRHVSILTTVLQTEITEIMDRPQPRKSKVFIRPGPKNNTSQHTPSPDWSKLPTKTSVS